MPQNDSCSSASTIRPDVDTSAPPPHLAVCERVFRLRGLRNVCSGEEDLVLTAEQTLAVGSTHILHPGHGLMEGPAWCQHQSGSRRQAHGRPSRGSTEYLGSTAKYSIRGYINFRTLVLRHAVVSVLGYSYSVVLSSTHTQ